ncbi:hypothetical protein IU11_15595 [Cellulosimicrobium sp. MM]|nr:hypothetical protein IU11_15595 [Cellulosimicrobium sp. MM]
MTVPPDGAVQRSSRRSMPRRRSSTRSCASTVPSGPAGSAVRTSTGCPSTDQPTRHASTTGTRRSSTSG